MLSTSVFETRSAKLVAAVACVLLFAALQVAVQAKPAHAWEVSLSIKGAGQITEVTNKGLIASDCSDGLSSPNTTPTGVIGDSCSPGSPSGGYNSLDIIEYRATPTTGFTLVGWRNGDDTATYNPVICDNSGGSPNYLGTTATNCRFQIFENLKAQAVFADTEAPPQPSVSGPSQPVKQSASFTFSTTSDPTFKQFECRVQNKTSFEACNSPFSVEVWSANYPDGTYTFQVQARDHSNNVSSIRSASFTVDKTAPSTSITSAPSLFSNSNSATFNFSSNDASATYRCKLDGGTFTSCMSPKSYAGLSDGSHTFSVSATDSVGNTSTTSRGWTIDTARPETALDPSVGPAPNSTTQDNDPVFEFSSNEAGATFECNLTGPGMTSTAFTACPSPKSYPNLKDGAYTFKVRAKDQATNLDDSPESRTWTINNTPTVLENSLTPLKAATGVTRNTNVSASFSEEMAAVTLKNPDNTSSTFKLQMYNKKKKKWIAIPATITLTNTNQTATLDPYGAAEGDTERLLAANKKFRAMITTGAKDADGSPLAQSFVWTFNTGSL